MILTMLRLQKESEVNFRTWHFQGVGMQGSHYSLRSVVLYSEPKQDLSLFAGACAFLFNQENELGESFTGDSFEFVEAHLRDEHGEQWKLNRTQQGCTVFKNNISTSLECFHEAIIGAVSYPNANITNRKIVGAWQVSKKLLVAGDQALQDDQDDALAASLRTKEHDFISHLRDLVGKSFVMNRGNLLDLYDQLDKHLAYKQLLATKSSDIGGKIKEVGRYGVRRLELIKNECLLLERMRAQLEVIEGDPENNTETQVLEKIVFIWNRLHSVGNFIRTVPALISFARKLLVENGEKIENFKRISIYRSEFKGLMKEQEIIRDSVRSQDLQLKMYFSKQRIDLAFFNQNSWQKFFQLMDCWLLMDGLAESTVTSMGRQHDLFMHQQMENPVAIYLLPSEKDAVDSEKFVGKLRLANQTIFRIFLTDNVQFHDALVKAGMGWAQAI